MRETHFDVIKRRSETSFAFNLSWGDLRAPMIDFQRSSSSSRERKLCFQLIIIEAAAKNSAEAIVLLRFGSTQHGGM